MSWLRKEPIGPSVTTALNQLLRNQRDAPAHQVMPTENNGVTMAPDRATDALLADAGIHYLDIALGIVVIDYLDGQRDRLTHISKRQYLDLRNLLTKLRGIPRFVEIGRFQVNAAQIRTLSFIDDEEVTRLFIAIQNGRATIEDLRGFAYRCKVDRHAGH